jgi:magnesium transporter
VATDSKDSVTGNAKTEVYNRVWRDGNVIAENFPFAEISDYLERDDCLVWVDLCDPDHSRLQKLADELTLDPNAVEDAVSQAERAKATRYATHTFVTAYATKMREDRSGDADSIDPNLEISRVSAFVLKRGIVTVRYGDSFDMADVLARWEENSDLLKYGVGALVHGLLDAIVDSHFEAVQVLDDAMEAIEDDLFDDNSASRQVQRKTYRIRRDLVELRRVVLPMREVVNAILRHRKDIEAPAAMDSWYDDLYDHVLRASEWTESLRDMVSTVFETNLSLQDARLNTVMKKLTSWAAIIAVPTAVTGYFGQNVPYPGFGKEWGFVLSVVVMALIAGGLYLSFKRRDWL